MEYKDDYVPPAGAAYEPTDINAGVASKFAIWILVSAVLIHIGIWGLFRFYAGWETSHQASEYPLAARNMDQVRLPPAPRLQPMPLNDIAKYREEQHRFLTTYGWVDKNAGVVHIPIEEAMRLTLERGALASRPADPAAPQVGSMPQDSSGGRTLERRTLVAVQ